MRRPRDSGTKSVVEGMSAIAQRLPFALCGLDTDNESAFMSETLQGYCVQNRIELTRSRAYHKNDQAWVEQKNGAVVRRPWLTPITDSCTRSTRTTS